MGNLTGPTLTISDSLGEYGHKEKSRVKSNLRLKLLFWQADLSLGCMGHNKCATCPLCCRAGEAFHVFVCSLTLSSSIMSPMMLNQPLMWGPANGGNMGNLVPPASVSVERVCLHQSVLLTEIAQLSLSAFLRWHPVTFIVGFKVWSSCRSFHCAGGCSWLSLRTPYSAAALLKVHKHSWKMEMQHFFSYSRKQRRRRSCMAWHLEPGGYSKLSTRCSPETCLCLVQPALLVVNAIVALFPISLLFSSHVYTVITCSWFFMRSLFYPKT